MADGEGTVAGVVIEVEEAEAAGVVDREEEEVVVVEGVKVDGSKIYQRSCAL